MAVARLLDTEYCGVVPASFSVLVGFPGIGPKMANMIMSCAFGETVGIVVDTHVHRICTTLKWVRSKQPEHTRHELEAWVPKSMWREFSWLLVGLGQQSQGSRELLVSRCVSCKEPAAALRLLKRIGVKLPPS